MVPKEEEFNSELGFNVVYQKIVNKLKVVLKLYYN